MLFRTFFFLKSEYIVIPPVARKLPYWSIDAAIEPLFPVVINAILEFVATKRRYMPLLKDDRVKSPFV